MKNIFSTLFTLILFFSLNASAQQGSVELIKTGAYIINMGNTNTGTMNDDLRPYGLIYDLIRNHQVPIKWAINPNKSKDGIDFTHNGVNYRGGTFIVPAEFRTSAVNARITHWQGQGVVGNTSVSDFSTFIAYTLKSFPRWTLDEKNGSIALAYLTAAGLTSSNFPSLFNASGNSIYNWLSPQSLGCCNDLFAMPHADPTWATHSNLLSWNQTCRGAIWAACRGKCPRKPHQPCG